MATSTPATAGRMWWVWCGLTCFWGGSGVWRDRSCLSLLEPRRALILDSAGARCWFRARWFILAIALMNGRWSLASLTPPSTTDDCKSQVRLNVWLPVRNMNVYVFSYDTERRRSRPHTRVPLVVRSNRIPQVPLPSFDATLQRRMRGRVWWGFA